MVGPDFIGEPGLGAKKGGGQFGDQLLEMIVVLTPAAEAAVEAAFVSAPMSIMPSVALCRTSRVKCCPCRCLRGQPRTGRGAIIDGEVLPPEPEEKRGL